MEAYRIAGGEPHAYRYRLVPVARAPVTPAAPPREWVDPATGHRVIRLSEEAGSESLYFHQNGYTATGDKLLITVPDGLATVDLKTRAIERVVTGRVSHVVVGPKSRQVFYVKDGAVLATHLDTKATRTIVTNPALRSGSGLAVNATETLLAGSFVEPGAPAPPRGGRSRGPVGGATADGALHHRHRVRGRQDGPQEHRLAESCAVLADRSDAPDVLPRGAVAQAGPHLDHPHRRHRPDQAAHAADGHGDCGPRVLQPRRPHDLVRPADAEERGVLAGGGQSRDGRADALRGCALRTGRCTSTSHPTRSGLPAMAAGRKRGRARQRPVDLPLHACRWRRWWPSGWWICRANDYRLEPNATFTPDGRWIVFRSNMHGAPHVYAVEVERQPASVEPEP